VYISGVGWGGPNFGLALDESTREEDTIFTAGEVKFAVDKGTEPHLCGAVLDYSRSWLGGGFTIMAPRCGTSCGPSCSPR